MKKYISIRNRKKSRGVAVIFTLGILGLLTVMALGFASTALLNRKIADNTSSADYARHIAKNIALARAKWAVLHTAFAEEVYSQRLPAYTASNGKTSLDFLHRMDTVLDGVELYRITDDSAKIKSNTPRWMYVHDPSGKILGRYAYAAVSASGLLDPIANTGNSGVSGRYGFTEKELSMPTVWNNRLKGINLSGNRWSSFKELVACLNLTKEQSKTFLSDGIGINQQPSPEAYWVRTDTTRTDSPRHDEMYLRYNMPISKTGWEKFNTGTTSKIDALVTGTDTQLQSASANSITFIPWLAHWQHSRGDWNAASMKKQIAANIVQYNLPKPTAMDGEFPAQKTISDQDGNWLINAPTYAGIGRHPMLNEFGFAITVKGEVKTDNINPDPEGPPIYQYTPKYKISVDTGAELIYPFSDPTSENTAGEGVTKSWVKFAGGISIKLTRFQTQEEINKLTVLPTGLDGITILDVPWVFKTDEEQKIYSDEATPKEISTWKKVDHTLVFAQTDWLSSPAYTKASSFWKIGSEQVITLPSFTLPAPYTNEDKTAEVKNWLEVQHITCNLKNTVLRYNNSPSAGSGDTPEPSEKFQRDFAMLPKQDITTTLKIGDKKRMFLIAYQTTDPLVNHKESDWSVNYDHIPKESGDAFPSDSKEINKVYPGSVFDEDGDNKDTAGCHLNKTVKSLSALLTDKEGSTDVDLEPATDPAYNSSKRLSSSYIRHDTMKSFWELGFISRAEAFKTLNLARTRVFSPGTPLSSRGGGTFAQGDANILDQIKFSEEDPASTGNPLDSKWTYGKVNLNSINHQVFQWLFNQDASGANIDWYKNLISFSYNSGPPVQPATDPYEANKDSPKINLVCDDTGTERCMRHICTSSCSEECLAHLLLERSRILPFTNRSDLLLDPDADKTSGSEEESNFENIPGYSSLSSAEKTKLEDAQRNLRNYLLNPTNVNTENAKSKLVREQYAARFMNLLKTDAPWSSNGTASASAEEHIYIIVLAQSIQDIGGGPAFADWNRDGEYKASGTVNFDTSAKFLKTGYVRNKLYDTGYEIVKPLNSDVGPEVTSAVETITTTTIGTYDYGADKITGETKLIVEMIRDRRNGKWRIAGYRYVE